MPTRRIPALAILALVIAVGLGAGLVYANASKGGGGEAIPWHLDGMGGANSSLADSQVSDPNILRVHIEVWPSTSPDDSWLVPSVDYGSDGVTVTLRPDEAHALHQNGLPTVGWYDTGGWVNVRLSEPVGRRALYDGSTSPATQRCNTLACH